MTIEFARAATTARMDKGGIVSAHSQASDPQVEDAAGGVSSFSAVLGKLRTDVAVAEEAVVVDALPASGALPLPVSTVPDPLAAVDPAALLAQAIEPFRTPGALAAPGAAVGVPGDLDAGRPRPAMAATSMRFADAAPAERADAVGSAATPVLATSLPPLAGAVEPSQPPLPAAGPGLRGSFVPSRDAAGPAGESQRAVLDAAVLTRAEGRAAFAALTDGAAFVAAPWADGAGQGARGTAGLRAGERAGGRVGWLSPDATAPGAGGSLAATAAQGPGAASVATPDAPMAPGASSEIAHKVHYWVTRGVQAAEIQLDALGGSAVDVSITVQGKEALIEFRSDQPEARRMLQDAMPQLRDMLRGEGLQLAGGFVGTAGQQQGQTRRDADTPEAEYAGTPMAAVSDAARVGPASTRSVHALDVFV